MMDAPNLGVVVMVLPAPEPMLNAALPATPVFAWLDFTRLATMSALLVSIKLLFYRMHVFF